MKSTKKAFLLSMVSMLLCVAMLMGTTFAWFTDTVTSGVNTITAGNLDIDVQYTKDNGAHWADLEGSASVFSSSLWEPGHTEYVTLKIENKGTLAFKYRMNVTPVNEKGGINVDGESFKLSDYLKFGTTLHVNPTTVPTYADRASARDAVTATATGLNQSELTQNSTLKTGETDYITLVVYMPEDVGNVANYKTGTTAPEIELGIKFIATQYQHETDSFGEDYDQDNEIAEDGNAGEKAPYPTIDTVIAYNYFPQTNQVAQLKKSENVAIKDGDDNHVVDDNQMITIKSDAKVDTTNNPNFAEISFANNSIAFAEGSEKATVTFDAKQTATGNFTVEGTDMECVTYDISATVSGGTFVSNAVRIVKFFVGEGKQSLTLKHGTDDMTNVDSLGEVDAAEEYYYDATTGFITMAVTHFSEFVTEFNAPVAAVGTKAYYSVENAIEAADENTVALIRDVKEAVTIDQPVAINLNGKTMTELTVNANVNIGDSSSNGKVEKLTIADEVSNVKLPDGAVDKEDITGDTSKIGFTGNSSNSECVAAIGDIKYLTLTDAIIAAGTAQTTVKLLKDASGDGVDVAGNQNIIFDFGGYTYTLQGEMVGSSGTKTNGFRFLKGSTVKMMNGKLANGATTAEGNTPAKVMINSYAALTLENFSVDATTGAVAPSGSAYGTACLYISNGPAVVTGSGTYIGDPDGYVIYMANVEYYTDGAALIFDNDFDGSVSGKVTDGGQQTASVQIQNGHYDFGTISFTNGQMTVTGGTFSADPSKFVADGFKVDETANAWVVSKIPPVATIGDAEFITLADAIEKAMEMTNPTIELVEDIELPSASLEITKPLTIDGHGHTISRTENDGSAWFFTVQDNCTFKNIVFDGNNFTEGGSATVAIVWTNDYTKKTLTLEDVIVKNVKTKYAVDLWTYGCAVVNGKSEFYDINGCCFNISTHDHSLTINSGKFYNNKNSIVYSKSGSGANSAYVYINGGEFYNNTAEYGAVIHNAADPKMHINITGGSFHNNTAVNGAVIYYEVARQSDSIAFNISGATMTDNVNTMTEGVDVYCVK